MSHLKPDIGIYLLTTTPTSCCAYIYVVLSLNEVGFSLITYNYSGNNNNAGCNRFIFSYRAANRGRGAEAARRGGAILEQEHLSPTLLRAGSFPRDEELLWNESRPAPTPPTRADQLAVFILF